MFRGRRDRDHMVLGFTTTCRIITNNPVILGKVYSIQHYVIKFVCLRLPPIKRDCHNILTEILLKVLLKKDVFNSFRQLLTKNVGILSTNE